MSILLAVFLANVGTLMTPIHGSVGGGSPTYNILTESGSQIMTESGSRLETENGP